MEKPRAWPGAFCFWVAGRSGPPAGKAARAGGGPADAAG